jgi:hypothetical protein
MAKTNLTELADSYQFSCRGRTNVAGEFALDKEHAVPVVVKIYRDGKSESECTCVVGGSCEASIEEKRYGECPFVTKARED